MMREDCGNGEIKRQKSRRFLFEVKWKYMKDDDGFALANWQCQL